MLLIHFPGTYVSFFKLYFQPPVGLYSVGLLFRPFPGCLVFAVLPFVSTHSCALGEIFTFIRLGLGILMGIIDDRRSTRQLIIRDGI